LRQALNRDYFRGPEQTLRVQQWRKANPGYWKKERPITQKGQVVVSQTIAPQKTSCNASSTIRSALQDFCLVQDPVFVGLLSMVTGSTRQEDIAATIGELLLQGQIILELVLPEQCDSKQSSEYDYETVPSPGSTTANPQ
jgi:hypothetical protein